MSGINISELDLNAIMQWEDDVEMAGVFASTEELERLVSAAPQGANVDFIRGIIAQRKLNGQ